MFDERKNLLIVMMRLFPGVNSRKLTILEMTEIITKINPSLLPKTEELELKLSLNFGRPNMLLPNSMTGKNLVR